MRISDAGGSPTGLPNGYRQIREERRLGTGHDRFQSTVERLMTWDMHRHAGLSVEVDALRVITGQVAVLTIRLGGWIPIKAPVRVLDVVDEPTVQGFTYGTLPGHPEAGEERFLIHHEPDDTVRATIRAFSRPARWYTKLGAPVARRYQDEITQRYLDALAAAP